MRAGGQHARAQRATNGRPTEGRRAADAQLARPASGQPVPANYHWAPNARRSEDYRTASGQPAGDVWAASARPSRSQRRAS
eukprot:913822-Lingulodinium_polyedra.AAC.1